ncbi:MAG: hypothetical protein V1844_20245 [Pseudomonadota bacterium]
MIKINALNPAVIFVPNFMLLNTVHLSLKENNNDELPQIDPALYVTEAFLGIAVMGIGPMVSRIFPIKNQMDN